MSEIAVLKFGGTSVKNIARMHHVASIVATTPARKRLVIVSAMGDTTDYLVGLSEQCSPCPAEREVDLLLATGEQVSISLLALTLQSMGIRARAFTGPQVGIRTDGVYGNARIVDCDKRKLSRALSQCDVAVIAGFQGESEADEITTLGRGGSDTTAVAVAVAAGASICHIYTDVDGIFTRDPNKFADAELFPEISFDDALALANAGAQVMHPRALQLARRHNLELRIRNTFRTDHQGTLLTSSPT